MATLTWTDQDSGAWPRPLKAGSVIGVFAPSHQYDPAELKRAKALIQSWGLKIKQPQGLRSRDRYLAGSDEHRFQTLSRLMEDDEVEALWAVRGGYGCQRLLPWAADLWAQWPDKAIIGFSDLTALHLARYQSSGLVGYHAPVAVSLGKAEPRKLADLRSRSDLKKLLLGRERSGCWHFPDSKVLKGGQVCGPLLGGNLTLVVSLLAGPYRPSFQGAILMLEDLGEAPYAVDRLLTIVRQSSIWRQAAGLVFGSFNKCGPPAQINYLLREAAADFQGPVLWGAPFGHLPRNRFFPIGARAKLEA